MSFFLKKLKMEACSVFLFGFAAVESAAISFFLEGAHFYLSFGPGLFWCFGADVGFE